MRAISNPSASTHLLPVLQPASLPLVDAATSLGEHLTAPQKSAMIRLYQIDRERGWIRVDRPRSPVRQVTALALERHGAIEFNDRRFAIRLTDVGLTWLML